MVKHPRPEPGFHSSVFMFTEISAIWGRGVYMNVIIAQFDKALLNPHSSERREEEHLPSDINMAVSWWLMGISLASLNSDEIATKSRGTVY